MLNSLVNVFIIEPLLCLINNVLFPFVPSKVHFNYLQNKLNGTFFEFYFIF